MNPIEIKGVDKVIRNLRYTVPKKLGRRLGPAFVKAANMVMRESLKIVPVQTGNLKASWKIKKSGSGLRTVVMFGYWGVAYAPYVHEIPNPPVAHGAEFNIKHAAEIEAAKGTWRGTREGGMFYRGENQQWKFLEKPIKDNHKKILTVIASELKKVK